MWSVMVTCLLTHEKAMMGGLAMTVMSEGTDDSARATEEGKLEEEEL